VLLNIVLLYIFGFHKTIKINMKIRSLFLLLVLATAPMLAQKKSKTAAPIVTAPQKQAVPNTISEEVLSGFKFRGIGPALMSGRIADIAINPRNVSEWYIAVGSGGVWKTENAGTTFSPIFDKYGSFSIGCVSIDSSE
jgi:hypothetical protein